MTDLDDNFPFGAAGQTASLQIFNRSRPYQRVDHKINYKAFEFCIILDWIIPIWYPRPDRVWNRIPDTVRQQIIQLALDQPALLPRELAVRFTDKKSCFVSEASVYRLLAAIIHWVA
jgi:hypothetical protein